MKAFDEECDLEKIYRWKDDEISYPRGTYKFRLWLGEGETRRKLKSIKTWDIRKKRKRFQCREADAQWRAANLQRKGRG